MEILKSPATVDGIDIAGQAVFVTANSNHRADNSPSNIQIIPPSTGEP